MTSRLPRLLDGCQHIWRGGLFPSRLVGTPGKRLQFSNGDSSEFTNSSTACTFSTKALSTSTGGSATPELRADQEGKTPRHLGV